MTRTKLARPGPSTGRYPGRGNRSSLSVSTWKLVVTPLEEAGNAVEVTVEAENWLAALRRARKELGDEGGVPSGASCVMSSTGEVTILDAAQRRRYELARVADGAAAEATGATATSEVALDEAAPEKTGAALPEARVSLAPPPAASITQPFPAQPPAHAPAPAISATQPFPVQPVAPAAPVTQAFPSQPAAPTPRSALVPLQGRDESPSSNSPLTYRERAFLAPGQLTPEQLETALRLELDVLVQQLHGAPRGKFVNLAAFDHAFQGRPQRPPVATLQWKDWRGVPVFSLAQTSPLPSWHPSQGRVATSFAPPPPQAPSVLPQPLSAPPQAPSVLPQPDLSWLPAPSASSSPIPVAAVVTAAQIPPHTNTAPPAPQPVEEPTRDPTGDQDRRLAIAFEACQEVYFLNTPLQALDFAVKLLGDLVPAEAASGCIYDINTDEFRFVSVTGPGASERRAEAIPSSAGLLSAAVRSGRDSLVSNDILDDARYDAAVDGRVGIDAASIAYLPLQRKDRLLGMLQLINRQSRTGFSEADMAIASYVASQIAEFLHARRTTDARR